MTVGPTALDAKVLVLNKVYSAIRVVDAFKAFNLLIADKAEVIAVEPNIWQQCQFTKMLTPTRLNGLANVRRLIREKAEAWK